jgi:hypothetical protein
MNKGNCSGTALNVQQQGFTVTWKDWDGVFFKIGCVIDICFRVEAVRPIVDLSFFQWLFV